MVVEALKHAAGFYGEYKPRFGPEAEVLDRARDTVGSAAQPGAVDLDGLSRRRVPVDDGEPAGDRAAMRFRVKSELLA